MHHAMHYGARLADTMALQEGELHFGEGLLPHDGGRRLTRAAGAQCAQEGHSVAQEAEPRVALRQRGRRCTR